MGDVSGIDILTISQPLFTVYDTLYWPVMCALLLFPFFPCQNASSFQVGWKCKKEKRLLIVHWDQSGNTPFFIWHDVNGWAVFHQPVMNVETLDDDSSLMWWQPLTIDFFHGEDMPVSGVIQKKGANGKTEWDCKIWGHKSLLHNGILFHTGALDINLLLLQQAVQTCCKRQFQMVWAADGGAFYVLTPLAVKLWKRRNFGSSTFGNH